MVMECLSASCIGHHGLGGLLRCVEQTWGDIPFGRYALIAFGILLVIGDYSLKNRKLSKKVEGLEMRLKRISQQSESAESKT